MFIQAHWPIALRKDGHPLGQIPIEQRSPWNVGQFAQTWKVMYDVEVVTGYLYPNHYATSFAGDGESG